MEKLVVSRLGVAKRNPTSYQLKFQKLVVSRLGVAKRNPTSYQLKFQKLKNQGLREMLGYATLRFATPNLRSYRLYLITPKKI